MMWRFMILILLVVYAIVDPAWLSGQSEIIRTLTCHFFHANIFHLLANALTIYIMFRRWKVWQIIVAYVIAICSIVFYPVQAIGFSNIVYAMMGLKTPPLGSPWWTLPSTKAFLVVTVAMLLFPNVSAVTHIISFVMGLAVSMSVRWFNLIRNDSARYI